MKHSSNHSEDEKPLNHCSKCRAKTEGRSSCPSCGAYQDWRKHFSLTNVLGLGVFALIVILAIYIPPMVNAMNQHSSKPSAQASFSTYGGVVNAHIDFQNRGNRPFLIVYIRVDFTVDSGEIRTAGYHPSSTEDMAVEGFETTQKEFQISTCPVGIADPVTEVWVRNFDGIIEVLTISREITLTCN